MARTATTTQLNLRCSDEWVQMVDTKAKELGLDRSSFIRMACTAYCEGKTPAATPAVNNSALEQAMGLLLDRVEALEKASATFALFMDDGNERLTALEGTQAAVEAPASGLLERLMNVKPVE